MDITRAVTMIKTENQAEIRICSFKVETCHLCCGRGGMYEQTYNDGLHIGMKWVVCPECKGKITKTKINMEKKIIAYKGFDRDLKCRDFQYEIGKDYEMDGSIKLWEVLSYLKTLSFIYDRQSS